MDKDTIIIKEFIDSINEALIDNNKENIEALNEKCRTLQQSVSEEDKNEFNLSCCRLVGLISTLYVDCEYKIGDKVFVEEPRVCGIDNNNVDVHLSFLCTIIDIFYLYDVLTLKPTLGIVVRLPDGKEYKLRSVESIKYKIDE